MKKTVAFFLSCWALTAGAWSQTDPPKEVLRLFDYDRNEPLEIEAKFILLERDIKVHDISFATPKAGRTTAYLVRPTGKKPFAAVLFGHWGYGTRTEFLPEAIPYAEAGAVSLLIDFPWVRPEPWRKNVGNYTRPSEDSTTYIQAVIDMRRVLDVIESLSSIDKTRIAYIGHSYGAQFGAILGAVNDRIKMLALIGGTPDLACMYLKNNDPDFQAFRKSYPKEQIEAYIREVGRFDAIKFIFGAAPKPVLFQIARFEHFFGEAGMLRYADAAGEPKTAIFYNTGHELNDHQANIDRAI